jgi:dolichyl-diphosphooligosaccharide--protein glycosyltransferase
MPSKPAKLQAQTAISSLPVRRTPKVDVTDTSASRKLAYPIPHFSPSSINNTESLLRFVILALISAAAVASRLFAVVRHESVIHEL